MTAKAFTCSIVVLFVKLVICCLHACEHPFIACQDCDSITFVLLSEYIVCMTMYMHCCKILYMYVVCVEIEYLISPCLAL